MNTKTVFNTVGRVIMLESILLILPLAVSLIYREACAKAFLISIAAAAVLGGIICLLTRREAGKLGIKDGFAIVSLSWLFVSAIGSLPFIISGEIPSFADAFFETVSGFTTTGASILTDVESMSHGLLFWRSFTHWLGGMGILVFVMAITGKAPDRSINILRAEMPGHSVDKFTPRARNTAKILYCIYISLTLIEAVLLVLGKMPVFDSIVHALGTAGTGGFGIKADSIASYSPYLQWVITAFMLIFGISFNLYYLLLMRKWAVLKKANELWTYLGIFAAASLLITADIYPVYASLKDSVRLSAFQVSSLLTTTGYATADFNTWPQLSRAVLFIMMFLGGCMGSTAGGFKMSRISVLFQIARNELRRSVNPRAVASVRLNGTTLDSDGERAVLNYLVLYLAVIVSVFLLISFEGFGFETNLTAAVSCVNNIGPGLGVIGPAGSYAGYSQFSKLVLSLAMLMGRLEIYPLLTLFTMRKRS